MNPYITDFYNSYDEDGRLASRHGAVEFLTTMHYIDKYIKPGDRVLEIGAGTGRYSHALARREYEVDAVELVARNIEMFRRNTRADERISIIQGNALHLSGFPDNQYDITLLLGPLYHLYSKEDKQQAIREALRVTKPGGIIFAAYVISDGCSLLMREAVDAMDDDTFQLYLKYHLAVCERGDLLGVTSHAVDFVIRAGSSSARIP